MGRNARRPSHLYNLGSSRVSVELAHLDGVQPAKPAGSRPCFFSDQLVSSMTRHQPGWLHKNPRRTTIFPFHILFATPGGHLASSAMSVLDYFLPLILSKNTLPKPHQRAVCLQDADGGRVTGAEKETLAMGRLIPPRLIGWGRGPGSTPSWRGCSGRFRRCPLRPGDSGNSLRLDYTEANRALTESAHRATVTPRNR